ncbi:hypothetical protein LIER_40938 [Lithospermum erythrorhizon]|uniref:CRIB domain-containing protein n=1 Tax=Lithospermum erythrorhizon TaxID=34254 RepID=A0AAV3R2Z1_LITER
MGCMSQSSVAFGSKEIKKHRVPESADQENKLISKGEEKADGTKRRTLWAALEFPKLRISEKVNLVIMHFKTLSHLFVYKEDIEEIEVEMEIGQPTDVKHVTHIGWDGSTTVNPQFNLAMSAQTRGPPSIDGTLKSAL